VEVQVPARAGGRLSAALVLPIAAACAVALAACGRTERAEDAASRASAPDEEVVLTPKAAREGRAGALEQRGPGRSRARVVELRGAGADPVVEGAPSGDAPSPGAPTDAEVRAELREARAALANFKRHLNTTAFLETGPQARVLPDGSAMAPEDAPDVVKRVILAANEIARFPYKWGGGHGAWRDNGYDCSGSVSFALAGAGLLGSPLTSGGFLDFGAPGAGQWITIYTNYGHVFMVVAGLRFDTSGRGRLGTRWQDVPRSTEGFAVRHIPGL
jgi:cell wall-associated NlpC family hydrolase